MGLDNPLHLAFLLAVLLVVFGARRLPEMGRSLGSGMRGFRDALSGESPAAARELHASTAVLGVESQPMSATAAPVEALPASARAGAAEASSAPQGS